MRELAVYLQNREHVLSPQRRYYLVVAHGRLRLWATNAPGEAATLGYFVFRIICWYFQPSRDPAVQSLRLNGRPVGHEPIRLPNATTHVTLVGSVGDPDEKDGPEPPGPPAEEPHWLLSDRAVRASQVIGGIAAVIGILVTMVLALAR